MLWGVFFVSTLGTASIASVFPLVASTASLKKSVQSSTLDVHSVAVPASGLLLSVSPASGLSGVSGVSL